MKTLEGEGFNVVHDVTSGVVRFKGSLRLGGLTEYAPVAQLLEQAMQGSGSLVLDLAELEFLNSSGIATLSRFVIAARNANTCEVTIRGSSTVPWQGKSLNNLKRLMPALHLSFD